MSYLFNGPKGVEKVPPQQWVRTLRYNQRACGIETLFTLSRERTVK